MCYKCYNRGLQIPDGCAAVIKTTEASAILLRVPPLGAEKKPLSEALGHALAENIHADRDLPPAERSAMDGFAVRSADLITPPRELKLAGELAAGSAVRLDVTPGTCVRIMTGANIPQGADTVVMVKKADDLGDRIRFSSKASSGENIIHKAEDARRGELLLAQGALLGPLRMGVCAAVGKGKVIVYRRPRIALICTGEELRDTDAAVEPHELRNSNGPTLYAALTTMGFPVVGQKIVRDSLDELVAQLAIFSALADVIILTGGVSKGKFDFVRAAVESIGATIRFHGVAMKPGKPLLCATLENNRFIFGLPGNPLAAMTGFYEFVVPTLRRLSGIQASEIKPSFFLATSSRITTKGGRTHFVLARLENGISGLCVSPLATRGSSDFVSGGRSDGAIVIPPEIREVEAGTIVEFHLWKPLF